MSEISNEPIDFSVQNVLWNGLVSHDKYHVKNFICLLTKQYIYRQKCFKKPLSIQEFVNHVYRIRNIERYNALIQGKLKKHNKNGIKPKKPYSYEQSEYKGNMNINTN